LELVLKVVQKINRDAILPDILGIFRLVTQKTVAFRDEERHSVAILRFGTRGSFPNLVSDLDVRLSGFVIRPELF
jgi:hypothetical protein